jgi:2-polyprenyl-3-methyl-5-hydroxy-6-metoxy-1,4-benzoquinol methylase
MTVAVVGEQLDQHTTQRDAFLERVLGSVAGAFSVFALYIGDTLGLYDALAQYGPHTSFELAERTGTHERYAREWLEQQTITDVLEVENPEAGPTERRYRLPSGHAEVLTERDSLNYVAPLGKMIAGATMPIQQVLDAYRNGGGVPFSAYGMDMREGQAAINRAMFLQELPNDWLPNIPGLHERLQSAPPARIADIGCGAGWSTIAMARAYPNAIVEGYDLDGPSIALARDNAARMGLTSNLSFHVRDAGDSTLAGQYDLVTAFECIHDMSDPVRALRTIYKLAGQDGTVLVADERVSDTFNPEGNDVEWMMYGWSILHCLPVGMADQPSAGTGTVMRADALRAYAKEAGFREVEVLPIDNFFFRIYRLVQ